MRKCVYVFFSMFRALEMSTYACFLLCFSSILCLNDVVDFPFVMHNYQTGPSANKKKRNNESYNVVVFFFGMKVVAKDYHRENLKLNERRLMTQTIETETRENELGILHKQIIRCRKR